MLAGNDTSILNENIDFESGGRYLIKALFYIEKAPFLRHGASQLLMVWNITIWTRKT